MVTLAWIVGSIVVVVLIVLGLPWFSDRMTRGHSGPGAGGNALGALDGVFNPGAARAQTSLAQEKERKGSASRGAGGDDSDDSDDDDLSGPPGTHRVRP